MSNASRMQALAHRATAEQMVAVAEQFGWSRGDFYWRGMHRRFFSPQELAAWDAAEVLVFQGMAARDYLRLRYRGTVGSRVALVGPGTEAERAQEEEFCGRLVAAFELAGVSAGEPTETERAFASCGGSFQTL